MSCDSAELIGYLDTYLRVGEGPDYANALNGLQVANSGKLSKIAVAVDACQATIDAAAGMGADLLIVHHGLFWSGLEPLTGRHGRRVRALYLNDIALYSAHLPLDCHPEVGNNAVLARDLGLAEVEGFGEYNGVTIGVMGSYGGGLADLVDRLRGRLGGDTRVIACGPAVCRKVAIVSGAASDLLRAARDAGVDTFVTGEGPHHTYLDAEEWGMNLIYAGHYATETVGVIALAGHLERRFGMPWEFVDHPTGL
ncbi:MAG: Nif3-like dinuclear metal center hexameric protein [Gemmatimonadales bacterium]